MKKQLSILIALALAMAALAVPSLALAAPPNDDITGATVIAALPFSDTLDTTEATTASDDPFPYCASRGEATVWYTITPTQNMHLEATTSGSSYSTTMSVYTGSRGSLVTTACGSSQMSFNATANQTYFLLVGAMPGAYPSPGGVGGTLVFSVQASPPPSNDSFTQAVVVGALPFSATVDTSTASAEVGEPTPSCGSSALQTVWYAFTPATGGSYSASVSNSVYPFILAVYSGSALNNLREVACRWSPFWAPATARLEAGVTYYYQLGSSYSGSGQTTFYLSVAPPPQAEFFYSPSDPSIFETIEFNNMVQDPAGIGIETWSWDFGDGTVANAANSAHRYAADGDYTVQLSVTTSDGRTAASSQTVRVATHDVAITKLSVPQSASAGQTRNIVVALNSRRYPEGVEVQLFRSVPGGFELVGTLTQSVPVRPSNRTTSFDFSYTFTSDDANIGKVTFKAIATLTGARDALPADNEAVATPTKVSKK